MTEKRQAQTESITGASEASAQGLNARLPAAAQLAAGGRTEAAPQEPLEGVYIISVAARILEMHPQTLRKYERVGLIRPSRTLGMLRLYSDEDITRLRFIKYLVDDIGMNLAGVEYILNLLDRLLEARGIAEALQARYQMPYPARRALQHLVRLLDITK